jgi:hypothetical protein
MGKLRDRMIEEMKLRNFSPATQESYVYAVSDWPQQITGSVFVGHTSLLSTQRYLRLRPQNVDSAVSPFDRLQL